MAAKRKTKKSGAKRKLSTKQLAALAKGRKAAAAKRKKSGGKKRKSRKGKRKGGLGCTC